MGRILCRANGSQLLELRGNFLETPRVLCYPSVKLLRGEVAIGESGYDRTLDPVGGFRPSG